MKKLILLCLMSFLIVPEAFSFSIIKDPDLFYSFFEKPMTKIDFTTLKDGTTYEIIQYRVKAGPLMESESQCTIFSKKELHLTGSVNRVSVRSDAFSNDWRFSATDVIRPDIACEAVLWFNQGISAGDAKITITASAGKSEPFALYTNKGFIGVVPDNSRETEFVFDSFSAVFSFETDFLKPTTTLNSKKSLIARVPLRQ